MLNFTRLEIYPIFLKKSEINVNKCTSKLHITAHANIFTGFYQTNLLYFNLVKGGKKEKEKDNLIKELSFY